MQDQTLFSSQIAPGIHLMEAGWPLLLCFSGLLRFVQLKGSHKLLQLVLGEPPNVPFRQIGSAALEG